MKCKKPVLFLCVLTMIFILPSCWNYREVEKFAIVSGFAVDKKDDNYALTFEILDVKTEGRDNKITTKYVTSEGLTIFEAVRKTIKIVGKRLYFSHAEIIIISNEIANEGIIPILDWVSRDSELRYTLHFLVSKENSAKEILEQNAITSFSVSYDLNDMLRSQKSLSYATDTEEWQFMKDMASEGISCTLPTVGIISDNDKLLPEISGSAIFKGDKMVGLLDGEETKTMLFIIDKIKGGLLVSKEHKDNLVTNISLEIFKNKTKLTPNEADSKIIMGITTTTDVAIDEMGGIENYLEEASLAILKKNFEIKLEDNIKSLVKKVQDEYDSDIFGFGKTVKTNMPDLWKKIEEQWDEIFKTVELDVHSSINIKNSAFQSKPVKVGD